ncbi:hypothetical protein C4F49_02355 [Sphingobacterium sp. KB22]|uniref:Uncharacterized protein n=2 Tax=Sphingobacterium hungaricum TaxID=2082723 RepID=A0A928UTM5_9SPHI|nr:hypothetical protein [Sphingobacterium hungaricum]
MCAFNYTEIFIGALLGILLTIIYDSFKDTQRKYKARKLFSFFPGIYRSSIISNEFKSKATISYNEDNILQIIVQHESREWRGTIKMETPSLGTLSYAYTDRPDEVGLKTIIPSFDKNQFTLIPEPYYLTAASMDYTKEIFIKEDITSSS